MSIGGEGGYGDDRDIAAAGTYGRGRTRRLPDDEAVVDVYDEPRRQPPRVGRSMVTVVGVVVLLIAAIAFANRDGGASSGTGGGGAGNSENAARPTAPTGERPVTSRANGVPAGFAHTEQGAQSAAANYAVALGGTGMFETEHRHMLVDTLYTPEAAARIKGPQDRAYSEEFFTRLGLTPQGEAPEGTTLVSRTVPVGTRVTEYQGDSATVDVWYTGLIGLAGEESTTPVTTTWKTWTFELRWTGSDWKIADDSQQDGPAPVPGDLRASTAEEISKAVEEFGGMTYAR
ncbi:hypothetical protein F0L17_11645 [Streptomyces sp. TRM43335]|uniref:DUF8175 domain-containing protein n=1 Tax=Streptomyces taklimakanensis TaxID=2569853 RepID=A0A6G2BCB1_9ACTN|nr:hypothetical protein [Streptomyces taklimakanensis]MTE19766.1 hypothetical protein [Streptomyces taklimakanensis]